MGRVACPEHGVKIGVLVSSSLADRCLSGEAVLPMSIKKFEVVMNDQDTLAFWSDCLAVAKAGLPTNRKLTMEEFLAADRLECFPVCPDCARHWLRENNIDPKDIGLG
jgi:hypothetical protein